VGKVSPILDPNVHNARLAPIIHAGRQVEVHVIDIVRLEDGRIVEHWNIVDRLGLLQQLGALPAPAAAATPVTA
jgi:predicted ester cyclase